MSSAKLNDYVSEELSRGVNQTDLASALKKEGWQQKDITNAINKFTQTQNMHNQTPISQDLYVNKQPSADVSKEKKSKIKLPKILLILALILFIIGIGTVTVNGLNSKSAQNYVEEMVSAMQNTDSLTFEGTMEYESEASVINSVNEGVTPIPTFSDLNLDFTGALQGLTTETQMIQIKASIDSDRFYMGEGEIIATSDNEAYIKLYDLGLFEGTGLEPVKNVWIKLDDNFLSFGNEEQTKVMGDFVNQIISSVNSSQIFASIDKAGNEKINGHSIVVINYELDASELKTMLAEYLNANAQVLGFTLEQKDTLIQDLEELVINKAVGSLGIDKNDYMLRKFEFELETQSEKYGTSSLKIQLILDSFNTENLITLPTDYKTSTEIENEIEAMLQLSAPLDELTTDNNQLTEEDMQNLQLDPNDEDAFLPQGF